MLHRSTEYTKLKSEQSIVSYVKQKISFINAYFSFLFFMLSSMSFIIYQVEIVNEFPNRLMNKFLFNFSYLHSQFLPMYLVFA
jgi:hypothetical protein